MSKKSENIIAFIIASFVLLIMLVAIGNAILLNSKTRLTKVVSKELSKTAEVFETPSPSPKPQTVKILLAGDVMLGRTVTIESLDKNNDPTFPFWNVGNVLQNADLVFVNLESPIVADCPRIYEGYTFCAPPQMLQGLVYSGIDIVTLANNHTYNFGVGGFNETIDYLNSINIKSVGYGNLVKRKIGDTTFGFLGFDFLTNTPTQDDYDLVVRSNDEVDVLVVGVHWGVEYVGVPNDYQVAIAEKLVNAGADLIAGHHPHWVQSTTQIKGVPVYYSLGNFVFDQMWSEETKKGLVVILEYEKDKIVSEERLNTYTRLRGQPEIVD